MRLTRSCTIAFVLTILNSACQAEFFAAGPSAVATQFTTGHGAYNTSILEPGLLSAGYDGRGPYTSTGLIKFTLSPTLPADAQVVGATLDLTATSTSVGLSGNATAQTFWLSGTASTPAAISLADFGSMTTSLGTTTLPAGIGIGAGPLTPLSPQTTTFDVSSLIAATLAGRTGAVSFEVTCLGMGGTFDAGTPRLSILYIPAAVPEPGSWLLVGLGLSVAAAGRLMSS